MIGALIAGTVLALCALAFVLYPVFFGVAVRPPAARRFVAGPNRDGDSAVLALREIEFDRETGKLSDSDYAELKARYTKQAIEAMREGQPLRASAVGPSGAAIDDEIEIAVRAYRAEHPGCPSCGPRPEPDATYCSSCGRYLHDRCAGCGAPVEALDARYCVGCGDRLAA